jgi:1-acyl-sn-glycerol-3-phosphate acyltransferase
LFGVDLFYSQPANVSAAVIGIKEFLTIDNMRLMIDIAMLGFFGGLYIVPLLALVQQRSDKKYLSRIIAGNNIINALLMVLSAIFAITVLSAGFSISELFLMVAILNAAVAIYIYTLVPEFFMRFLVWLLIHSIYHVKTNGLEKIPEKSAAVLVCNHVSFVDALIIAGCIRRPVRFVMHYKFFNMPVLNFIFRTARAIPIAGKFENEMLLKKAFDDIDKALADGDLVCVFPEGKLTTDGEMNGFKTGVEEIINRRAVPVIPMALQGLWGSVFSRYRSNIFKRLFKGMKSSIGLIVGKEVNAQDISAELLEQKVKYLRAAEK